MSRLRRVIDTSKLLPGAASSRAALAEGAKAQPEDVVRRFQEMIAPEAAAHEEAAGDTNPHRADERAADGPGGHEDFVLELTPEALIRTDAPPTHDEDSLMLDAPQPSPGETPLAGTVETAATGSMPTGVPSTWESLSSAASKGARELTAEPTGRVRLQRSTGPSAPVEGRGIRAWMAGKGAEPAPTGSDGPTTDVKTTLPSDPSLPPSIGLAGATAVRWADVLTRKTGRSDVVDHVKGAVSRGLVNGAQTSPAASAPETSEPGKPVDPNVQSAVVRTESMGTPPGVRDVNAVLQPDFASVVEQETSRAGGRSTSARPAGSPPSGTTAQTAGLFRAPEQPPGAMRIRLPTADGGTVRGDLRVDSESRVVRLTLAAEEAGTARSMATAQEMLRVRLAEEGYKLQSFVVRHDGRSLVSLDHPSAHGQASDGDPPSHRESDDNPHEPLPRPLAPELSGDPAIAGWFV